jgi:quercetin dioxygenase-like cupin family protein
MTGREGGWLWWLGHPARCFATGKDTADTYALVWGKFPPGNGAPPHSHIFHEGFYVVGGEITVIAGNKNVALKTGGFVHIAGGTGHHLMNESMADVELLLLAAPAGFDRFVMEAGHPVAGPDVHFDPPTHADIARLMAIAPKYGVDMNPLPSEFETEPDMAVLQSDEGWPIALFGSVYRILVPGDRTGGRYAVTHVTVPPGGGTPLHRHMFEEEGFYVLSGELTVRVGDTTAKALPGAFTNTPVGCAHCFKNESDKPATVLEFFAPGGVESFISEAGTAMLDPTDPVPPSNPEKAAALARKYSLELIKE